MPHIWNDIWVVVIEELIPLYKPSWKALEKEIQRYRDKTHGIKKVCGGGNGRQVLIAFDSLPKKIQEAIGDPRQVEHILQRFYQIDEEAVNYYQKYKFDDGEYLSLPHQQEYIINASVLVAAKQLNTARERERKSKGAGMRGMTGVLCKDVANFNKILRIEHNTHHTLPESLKRFSKAFNTFIKPDGQHGYNFKSLISGRLRNQNSRKVDGDVMQLLNDLFAGQGHKPNRTDVSRKYDSFLKGYATVIKQDGTGEVYDPANYKPLSEATIINYLGSWDERIGTYAKRSGDRSKLMEQFKPYHSLKRPEYSGSIISVDDRQPPFEYAPGERVWFYIAQDLGSAAITCWVWGKSKEGIILEFYRQMVRNYTEWGVNLPVEIEAESSLNNSYTETFLRPGVLFSKVRIEANNPRGKRIERQNRDFRYGGEKELEGWIPRPFAKNEANQPGPGKKVIIPYQDIVDQTKHLIWEHNNSAHPEHKDVARWDYFLNRQHPDTKPTNWHGILPTLGYATPTSVNRGIVKLQGGEYLLGDDGKIYTGERLIKLMQRVEGENVTAYWLDDNDGKVMKALVYLGDKCICEALPKPVYSRATVERTPADEKAREIMSAYVATIDGYMKRKRSSINDVLVIDERPKTISNSFVMPGLKQYSPEYKEPEIMPEVPEDEPVTYPRKPAGGRLGYRLKDRF